MNRVLAAAFVAMVALSCASAPAWSQAASPLSGRVTSAEGGMEGVVITARRDGSTIAYSVTSQKGGAYAFPMKRLGPGRYTVSIRATGYELAKPVAAEVAIRPAVLNITLAKTKDLAAQISNSEWIASFPGTLAEKQNTIDCMGCHTLERVARSKYDAKGFAALIPRMLQYANNTTQELPQIRPGTPSTALAQQKERIGKLANYLATVNLSARPKWNYDLKVFPRATGRATKALITTYALEDGTYAPHDVMVEPEGIYYVLFGHQGLGLLDPKTGKSKIYPVPEFKPEAPKGGLDLERDRNGNLWLGMMFQGAIARFDRKTRTFKTYYFPKELQNANTQVAMVAPGGLHVDGKVWSLEGGRTPRLIVRIDTKTEKFEMFTAYQNIPKEPGRNHTFYQIFADSKNNFYFLDFGDRLIGRLDAKTLEFTYVPTPTDRSRPRRGMMDEKDRLWFAEYQGNNVAMFDTKTKKVLEWKVPTPWFLPYQAVVDKNDEIWTAGMAANEIVRINTKTGQSIAYPLPEQANLRNLYVDNSTTPISVWFGNNHGGTIMKLEPLD